MTLSPQKRGDFSCNHGLLAVLPTDTHLIPFYYSQKSRLEIYFYYSHLLSYIPVLFFSYKDLLHIHFFCQCPKPILPNFYLCLESVGFYYCHHGPLSVILLGYNTLDQGGDLHVAFTCLPCF